MKKILTLALTGVSTVMLAACANGIPDCNNNQADGCGRGGPYTDERTAVSKPTMAVPAAAPVVTPPPAPAPQPAPAPVAAPEPAPAPADTTIMKQAEEPSQNK